MSRPKFLNCVMTPEIIRAIRQEQDYYDSNPERYELEKREEEERYRQEQEEMEHQRRLAEERNNYE
jgi:hypothetical protein